MNDTLYHHGIRGQKWGDRNGPPYPLNASEHRAVVKRSHKEKRRNASDMSNDELRAAIKRKELERNYVNSAGSKKWLSKEIDDISDKAINKARSNAKDTHGKKSQQAKDINAVDKMYREGKKLSRKGREKQLSKMAEKMSDDELRKRTERLNLENRYNDLNPTQAKKNWDTAREAIELTAAAIGTYKALSNTKLGKKVVSAGKNAVMRTTVYKKAVPIVRNQAAGIAGAAVVRGSAAKYAAKSALKKIVR